MFLFCQVFGDWDSCCQPVFWYIHKHSGCHLSMSSPPHLLYLCSPISLYLHLLASTLLSGLFIHCGRPGKAEPHLSQTNLSWSDLDTSWSDHRVALWIFFTCLLCSLVQFNLAVTKVKQGLCFSMLFIECDIILCLMHSLSCHKNLDFQW